MRLVALAAALLITQAVPAPAHADTSVGITVHWPGASVHLGRPAQPSWVLVPGLPVYRAPHVRGNAFFFDGLYWVLRADGWFFGTTFGGPWHRASPYDIPDALLRVPVRYFQSPPPWFRGWRADAPPRWSEHWGRDWRTRGNGWDGRDHRRPPAAAPAPRVQPRLPHARPPVVHLQRGAIHRVTEPRTPREPAGRHAPDRAEARQRSERPR